MSHETHPHSDAVPLFPLEAVLFPGSLLPLHIFEPRYRQMTADAIQGNGLIAIAPLRPGYEPQYLTYSAPIYPVVGVGRLVATSELPNGTYNIVLRGLRRARVVSESTDRPYRMGTLEPLNDEGAMCEHSACVARCELLNALEDAAIPFEFRRPWLELARNCACFSSVVDQICGTLPLEIDMSLRQNLQEEANSVARSRLLTEYLKTYSQVARRRIRCATETTGRVN
ncbi:MAG: LON peptidase substrate-binding domain-containing protein [Phycisphaerales bacterium]|nr:LON peptidase substrate-binding domain-containing protein [Phycisphaerales bacterium]